MTVKQIREFLDNKPGYKKEGAKRLAVKLTADGYTASMKSCKRALREARATDKYNSKQARVMIYDIETSRQRADVWWSGKQYINGNNLVGDPNVISIAYKWLGEEEVHCLKWDKNMCDKKMITTFLREYNQADMVIGYNNDRFDNKWINTRALKHSLEVNTLVKSFDIMKQSKSIFRLPSYSMNYLAKFLGVQTKLQHGGLAMWDAIQYGTKKEGKKAMKMMLEYNIQDIIVTEQVFLKVRSYMKMHIHLGVMVGQAKTSCPSCGGSHVKLHKTTVTAAGTVQHIMKCKDDNVKFKISNSQYLKMED